MSNNSSERWNAIGIFVCILVGVAIAIPALAQQRSRVRMESCAHNLKMIGLGIHNYHSTFKRIPSGQGGTEGGMPENSNQGRLGSLVALLPFVEEAGLWNQINNPYKDKRSGKLFPVMGPAPWYDPNVYRPWSKSPSIYICPDQLEVVAQAVSDKAAKKQVVYTLEGAAGYGGSDQLTNYVACFGDGTRNMGKTVGRSLEAARSAQATRRGIFYGKKVLRLRDVLDGLSNTIIYSETVASVDGKIGKSGVATGVTGLSMNPSLCLDAVKDEKVAWFDKGRGSLWCDGAIVLTGFQTVLPPNSPSCLSGKTVDDVIASASSNHAGGVHVLMADGAVTFVSDSIDTGDLKTPGVAFKDGYTTPGSKSPYGVWGALGTRASKEIIDRNLEPFATARDRSSTSTDRLRTQLQDAHQRMTKWTDKDGETQLFAWFVTIERNQTVVLLDGGGITHKVPLNSLADRDMFRAVQFDVMTRQAVETK